jgi:hypothetical protein
MHWAKKMLRTLPFFFKPTQTLSKTKHQSYSLGAAGGTHTLSPSLKANFNFKLILFDNNAVEGCRPVSHVSTSAKLMDTSEMTIL